MNLAQWTTRIVAGFGAALSDSPTDAAGAAPREVVARSCADDTSSLAAPSPLLPPSALSPQPIVGPTSLDKLVQVRGAQRRRGDCNMGRVVHLGVTHRTHAPRMHSWLRQGVIDSQLFALDALLALKPSHLFVEGLTFDFASRSFPDPEERTIKQIFAGWAPGTPLLPLQEEVLVQISAARIYTVLTGSAMQVHKTTSVALQDAVTAAQNVEELPSLRELFIHRREAFLFAELHRFFRQQPGEEAVVVFGASHDLAQGFRSGDFRGPDVYFSDLSSLSPDVLAGVRQLWSTDAADRPESVSG